MNSAVSSLIETDSHADPLLVVGSAEIPKLYGPTDPKINPIGPLAGRSVRDLSSLFTWPTSLLGKMLRMPGDQTCEG
jgi:hypothetical protein